MFFRPFMQVSWGFWLRNESYIVTAGEPQPRLTVVRMRLCSVGWCVVASLHSSQQASGKTDREWWLNNVSLARCSVSQAIEARLLKCKHLLSRLSYRGRVLIINNLAAVCL